MKRRSPHRISKRLSSKSSRYGKESVSNFIVLAEGTRKVAGAEEDRSGADGSHQWRFFTEVGMKSGHSGPDAGPAKSRFPAEPVHAALPGAQSAVFQQIHGLTNPCRQLSFREKLQIGGFSVLYSHRLA